MRDIRFRGYAELLKHFVYGFYKEVEIEGMSFNYMFWQGHSTPVSKESVGQFTTLQDKNGKDIYEGDILDAGDRIVQVFWHPHSGQWDTLFIKYVGERFSNGITKLDWKYRATVIGNIHENPELLK